MISSVKTRRATSLLIAGALVLSPFLIQEASALTPSVKDGDKCAKVGLKTRGSSGATLTCTRVGTTKALKWKRVVTKPIATTTTTLPTVTTVSQITIQDFAFLVAGDVQSTDALKVTNRDGATHTVTSETGVFDVTVVGKATNSLPSLSAGNYAFFCRIHTSMRGTLKIG